MCGLTPFSVNMCGLTPFQLNHLNRFGVMIMRQHLLPQLNHLNRFGVIFYDATRADHNVDFATAKIYRCAVHFISSEVL